MFDFSGIKKEKYNSLIIGIIIFLLIVFFVAFYYVYKLSYQSEVDSFLDHQDIYISVVRKKFKDRLDTIIQQPYNTRIKNREKAKLLSSDLEFPSLPEIKYTALLESSKNITTAVNQFEPGVDLEKIRGKIKTVTEKKWSDIDANYYIAPLEITKRHQLALVFYPVQTKNDKQILASVIDLEELTAEYIAPIQLKKNGTGYLIDGRGRVIYDRATEIIGSNVFNLHQTYEKLLAVDKKMINQEQGSAHYNFLLRKTGESKHKYISWASINFGSNKLILAISTPKSDIIAEMNDFRNKLMILSILLIIMLLLIGIIFFKLNSQVLKSKIEEYQEKYEEQTKELRMMSEMVEQSDDSMMQTDTKGNIEYINRAGEELFGWSREEIVGKKPAIFNAEENDRQIQNEIYQALEQGEKYEIELLNQRKDGSVFWCQMKAVPLINEKGVTYAFLGIQRDITQRIEREKKLKLAKEESEIANQAKSEFLANMSHEIRTPLNAVIGFSELLEDMVVDGQQKAYLNSIKTAGNNLLMLINDILDLSKIEAGELELKYDYFNLEQLLVELEYIFSSKINKQGLNFMIDIKEKLPLIKLDEIKLRQILINLIGNAVKFTETGYIKVIADIKQLSNDKLDLCLAVEDTGIGIPEEDQADIFRSFQQQDTSTINKYDGTGLGLTITKLLTEMMNGTISLESEVNVGTKFKLKFNNLEYKAVNKQLVKKESNNQIIFDTAKLLVVDDIASNRDLITAILQETNLQVITAADGQQAVQMAQKEEFDLILMDLKLPVLDGYQARKEIKKTKLNHNTAVLAVTASATIAEIEQVKQANFADFITKPLERDNLIAILAEHLEHQVENNSTVDVVEIDLNLEEIELAELVMELEEKFIPWYRELKEVFIINEVEDFATELVVVGQKYKFDFLVNYAEKLKEYAIEFQINETRQQFNKFTDIIEKLNNKLSKN